MSTLNKLIHFSQSDGKINQNETIIQPFAGKEFTCSSFLLISDNCPKTIEPTKKPPCRRLRMFI